MIYNKRKLVNVLLVIVAIFAGYIFANFNAFFNRMPKIEITNGAVKKFGVLKVGDSAAHYFKIKNVGNEDLKILNVSTSCGCTVPSWNSSPIKPSFEDSIQVVYDTNKIGPFNQSIEIYTNSLNKKEIVHVLGIVKD